MFASNRRARVTGRKMKTWRNSMGVISTYMYQGTPGGKRLALR